MALAHNGMPRAGRSAFGFALPPPLFTARRCFVIEYCFFVSNRRFAASVKALSMHQQVANSRNHDRYCCSKFISETFMKRRDFLARTAAGVSASLLFGNDRSDGYRFIGSALAAGE